MTVRMKKLNYSHTNRTRFKFTISGVIVGISGKKCLETLMLTG